jgi:hypothetical protein
LSVRREAVYSRSLGFGGSRGPLDAPSSFAPRFSDERLGTTGDHTGMTAFARASDLDGFTRKDVRSEVRLIWEAIRNARLAEADAQGRIADANKTLDGHDPNELRRRKTTLTEIGGQIQAAQQAIKEHEEKIAEQDNAIARFSKRLAAAGTPELAAFEPAGARPRACPRPIRGGGRALQGRVARPRGNECDHVVLANDDGEARLCPARH